MSTETSSCEHGDFASTTVIQGQLNAMAILAPHAPVLPRFTSEAVANDSTELHLRVCLDSLNT